MRMRCNKPKVRLVSDVRTLEHESLHSIVIASTLLMLNRMLFLVLVVVCFDCFAGAQQTHFPVPQAEQLGKVSFSTSCSKAVQVVFDKGVALLHSFQYAHAQASFDEVLKKDSHCAMAYWGEGMALYRPLWEWPTSETLKKGHELMEAAAQLKPKTERELAYIQAMAEFFQASPNLGVWRRRNIFAKAMAEVHERYPEDIDAACFYALSLLSVYENGEIPRKKAIAILKIAFASQPNHPGAAHYLIHAADSSDLALEGLEAARQYIKIAPSSAHALHMPAHIFSHLGLWQDTVASNQASVVAAANATLHKGDNESEYQLHAMKYLEYAYLQMGREADARQEIEGVKDIPGITASEASEGENLMMTLYVMETHRWNDAEKINPKAATQLSARMSMHCARAIANLHLGNIDLAGQEVEKFREIFKMLQEQKKDSILDRVLDLESESWLAVIQGKTDEAVNKMRAAVHEEASYYSVDLHKVPSAELLGDLLLEIHEPAKALEAYQFALKEAPNRLNSLHGAGHAAELSGHPEKAKSYYEDLLKSTGAQSDRAEVKEAQAFLKKK